jgi:deoxyxylulose-5-phosphate synthase
MSNIVWSSVVTKDLVRHLSEQEIEQLADELNEAVVAICSDYGVED